MTAVAETRVLPEPLDDPRVAVLRGDVNAESDIEAAIGDSRLVVSLAANSIGETAQEITRSMAEAAERVAHCCLERDVALLVHVSSIAALYLGDSQDVITGATPHRLILFTFDDGPNRHTTPRLLDYLDAAGVRGVFFVTASRIVGETRRQRIQQDIARDIVERGHMIGNHTLDHEELPALDTAQVQAQIIAEELVRIDDE